MKRVITTMFFVLVTFLKRAPRIIIHLARNAEKGGGVLKSVTLPNLKHSFIFSVPGPGPFPVPVPVPDPDPVPDFLVFHTPVLNQTPEFNGKIWESENTLK